MIPPTAGFAWVFAIVAIVLAIIAMVKRVPPRWMAPVGLGLAVLGWVIGIIVVIASVGSALSSFSDGVDAGSSGSAGGSAAKPSTSPSDEPAKIGDTVTNGDGVSFTVTTITCGLASAGDEYSEQAAKGQFCEVKYTIQNGGTKEITLISNDLTGYIGSAEYAVEGAVSKFGGDYFSTSVNPGLSADCDVFIDIPAGSALDSVKFEPLFSFKDGVTVLAK